MSYYDKKQMKIILSGEEKETFKEIASRNLPGAVRTPVANSIMKTILGKLQTSNKEF